MLELLTYKKMLEEKNLSLTKDKKQFKSISDEVADIKTKLGKDPMKRKSPIEKK